MMARAKSAENRGSQGRKPPEGKRFQKGKSGNPGGRPKNEISIVHWLKEWAGMTSEQAADACAMYAKELRKVDSGDIPLAGIAALRVWMSVVNEPSPGLLAHILDRMDGPVKQKIEMEGAKLLIKLDK
jgi:hypothetical protein